MIASRRRVAVWTFTSLVFWVTWELTRTHPHVLRDVSNGTYSDHLSHLNAARIFPRIGSDIWRKSFKAMFTPLSAEAMAHLPPDVSTTNGPETYFVPGWPWDKPLVASWSHNPRLYPPGDMLLVAPVALAYHFTSLSFAAAITAVLVLFLVYTHGGLYLVLSTGLRSRVHLLATLLVYFELIHWTLEGFYDAAAVFPLLLCARHLVQRKGLAACLSYTAALLLHFRALFFLPWGVFAVWIVLREGQWRRWRWRQFMALAVLVLICVAIAYPLLLLMPTLRTLPNSNPLSLNGPRLDRAALTAFELIALVSGLAIASSRSWLDLAMLAWFSVMIFFFMRETYPWHIVIPMTWLVAPVVHGAPATTGRVVDARIFFFLYAAAVVFHNPIVPTWISALF